MYSTGQLYVWNYQYKIFFVNLITDTNMICKQIVNKLPNVSVTVANIIANIIAKSIFCVTLIFIFVKVNVIPSITVWVCSINAEFLAE